MELLYVTSTKQYIHIRTNLVILDVVLEQLNNNTTSAYKENCS